MHLGGLHLIQFVLQSPQHLSNRLFPTPYRLIDGDPKLLRWRKRPVFQKARRCGNSGFDEPSIITSHGREIFALLTRCFEDALS
mmetsp:Transcript_31172/g.59257  ORF Transcript_31172/g.59257 Transcript_31172/m.59257 type:complete len:84 (+) Transcript_31172:394-645(+)